MGNIVCFFVSDY